MLNKLDDHRSLTLIACPTFTSSGSWLLHPLWLRAERSVDSHGLDLSYLHLLRSKVTTKCIYGVGIRLGDLLTEGANGWMGV
jgi:hypothetical protein